MRISLASGKIAAIFSATVVPRMYAGVDSPVNCIGEKCNDSACLCRSSRGKRARLAWHLNIRGHRKRVEVVHKPRSAVKVVQLLLGGLGKCWVLQKVAGAQAKTADSAQVEANYEGHGREGEVG